MKASAVLAALLLPLPLAAQTIEPAAEPPSELPALMRWADGWVDRGFDRPERALAALARAGAQPPAGTDMAPRDWQRTLWVAEGAVAARSGRHAQAHAAVERLRTLGKDAMTLAGIELLQAALMEHVDTERELSLAEAAAGRVDAHCDASPMPADCDLALAWRIHRRVELRVWVTLGRSGLALAHAEHGLALAERLGDADKQVQSLGLLAIHAHHLGRPEEAAAHLARARQLAAGSPGMRLALMALVAEGVYRRQADAPKRIHADRLWREAADLALRLDMPRWSMLALQHLADEHMSRQRWPQTVAALDEALPLMQGFDDPRLLRNALHNRGIARMHMGERAAGLADVERALAELLAARGWGDTRVHLRELADTLHGLNDPAAALAVLRREQALDARVEAQAQQAALAAVQHRHALDRAQQEVAQLAREQALSAARAEGRLLQQRLWATTAALAAMALLGLALALGRLHALRQRLRRSGAALRAQSERDTLTGLANRRHLEHALGGLDAAASGALLLVDIDHFKRINDGLGHGAGDRALQAVAARLAAEVRSGDSIARWGARRF